MFFGECTSIAEQTARSMGLLWSQDIDFNEPGDSIETDTDPDMELKKEAIKRQVIHLLENINMKCERAASGAGVAELDDFKTFITKYVNEHFDGVLPYDPSNEVDNLIMDSIRAAYSQFLETDQVVQLTDEMCRRMKADIESHYAKTADVLKADIQKQRQEDEEVEFFDKEPPEEKPEKQKFQNAFPEKVTSILRSWLFSHLHNPYPNEVEKMQMALAAGITVHQVSNWFINARRRKLTGLRFRRELMLEERRTRKLQHQPLRMIQPPPPSLPPQPSYQPMQPYPVVPYPVYPNYIPSPYQAYGYPAAPPY